MEHLKKLRKVAEQHLLYAPDGNDACALDTIMPGKVIHELHVQQIELEMQNDELHYIQAQLTASQKHFSALFNFAPCGYFTLSKDGIILGANLMAARILGVSPDLFLNVPFTRFVNNTVEDQNVFHLHHQYLLTTTEKHSCELRLIKKESLPVWVQIDSVILEDTDEQPVILAMVNDIDKKKLARSCFQTLTPREKEIFRLVVTGMLNKQIAGKLSIVEKTVKVHRAKVMMKMKAGSFAELVSFSHQMRLLSAE